jgi:hypothetical protein
MRSEKDARPVTTLDELRRISYSRNLLSYGSLYRITFHDSKWVLETETGEGNEWFQLAAVDRNPDLARRMGVALFRAMRSRPDAAKLSIDKFAAEVERTNGDMAQWQARLDACKDDVQRAVFGNGRKLTIEVIPEPSGLPGPTQDTKPPKKSSPTSPSSHPQ